MKRAMYLLLTAVIFLLVSQAFAFGSQENGWSYTVGGLVQYEPVYPGSDQYGIMPLPYVNITYTQDEFQFFAGMMNGIGTSYTHTDTGLFVSGGVDRGIIRDPENEKVDKLLEDTPKAVNYVKGIGRVGWKFFAGEIVTGLEYYPTTLEYANGDEKFYNAFLWNSSLVTGYPVMENLLILGEGIVSVMDESYADAFYSLGDGTDRLDEFDAGAGIHSVEGNLILLYFIHKKVAFVACGGAARYLGDAADSPFTRDAVNPKGVALLMYTF
ncbi:MAG: MipA/OmpV family protein [Spirochaetota bacterium]